MPDHSALIADCERLLSIGGSKNEATALSALRSVFQCAASRSGEMARKTHNELFRLLRGKPELLDAVVRQAPAVAVVQTPATWTPGVSLLTCCMDRNDLLVQSIKSWIAIDGVDEIVVLDWSSTVPVAYSLDAAGISDTRIRIVRVEGEVRWMASHAWNLAFRTVRHDTVLKIDCDVVVVPNFLANHSLTGNDFLAGNWRNAKPGQTHINGLVLIKTEDFMSSDGYDERIVTYGWEDDEFYDRLTARGMRRFDPQQDCIRHLDHADVRRTGHDAPRAHSAWQEMAADSFFWLALNRRLAEDRNPWPDGQEMSAFEALSEDTHELVLRRETPFNPETKRVGQQHQRVLAAIDALRHRYDCKDLIIGLREVERLFSRHTLADCVTLMGIDTGRTRLWSPPTAILPDRRRLLIDARYGLGNRMRAIASAAVFAKLTNRDLQIYWEQDHHCDCAFHDLFAGDYPLVAKPVVEDYKSRSELVIDLMDEGGGTDRLNVIDVPDDVDLFVTSAFTLLYPHKNDALENQYLRSLIPAPRVCGLIDHLPDRFDVTAHIRMQGSASAGTVAADARGERSAEEHDTIDLWRQKSHYEAFVKRLDGLVAQGAQSIFVASDSPEAYEVLSDRYGDKIFCLTREVYDRSSEQLMYALADLLLLARAPVMLGSGWSSFTEVAHRLAPAKQRLELSGQDF